MGKRLVKTPKVHIADTGLAGVLLGATPEQLEAETRAELIDPAIAEAGWGKVDESRVRLEVIAPGSLMARTTSQYMTS